MSFWEASNSLEILPFDQNFKRVDHQFNQLQAKSTRASTARTDTVDYANGDDPKNFLSVIRLELSAENVDAFVSVVGEAYKTSFKHQYIWFAVVGDFLVKRRYIHTNHA